MTPSRRVLVYGYGLTSFGIVCFWIGFFSGLTFPLADMRQSIPHFEGYYAWETAFFVPDMILAGCSLYACIRLAGRRYTAPVSVLYCAAVSGACIFLGLLDISYDANNGMYLLGNLFSANLIAIAIYLPVFGLGSLTLLAKTHPLLRAKR